MFGQKKKLFALGRLKSGEMNKTETAYDLELKRQLLCGDILWYKFEGITLKLADNTRYTPDFAVLNKNSEMEMHEVKGARAIFQDDAKVKVKVANEVYPFVFKVIYPLAKNKGGGWEIDGVGNGN
jgi:hypothetical protein